MMYRLIRLMSVPLVAMPLWAFGQVSKELVPQKFAGTVILATTKNYTYYALSQKTQTKLTVTGPGELTVFNRVRIGKDETQSDPFELKYIIDGSKVRVKSIAPLKASAKTTFVSKLQGIPTQASKTVIRIPPGKHVIEFYKNKSGQPVHSRFLFKLYNRPVWKDIRSTNELEAVNLKYSSGKEAPGYYRITSDDAFTFAVSDSARLRILVRDEFTYKMLAENYLRVEITEEGKEPKVYKFLTKRAKNIGYAEMSKFVPSYLKNLYLDLPKTIGQRKYTIKLKTRGASALIRVSYDTNLDPKE